MSEALDGMLTRELDNLGTQLDRVVAERDQAVRVVEQLQKEYQALQESVGQRHAEYLKEKADLHERWQKSSGDAYRESTKRMQTMEKALKWFEHYPEMLPLPLPGAQWKIDLDAAMQLMVQESEPE
jgi:predicted nuclease with TOPRIM domain